MLLGNSVQRWQLLNQRIDVAIKHSAEEPARDRAVFASELSSSEKTSRVAGTLDGIPFIAHQMSLESFENPRVLLPGFGRYRVNSSN